MLPDGKTEFSGHIDLLQRYEGAAAAADNPFGADDDSEAGDGDLWVVTDFKTGLYGDFDDETSPRQLQWYAWLVQQSFPQARAFEVRLHSLRTGHVLSWRLSGDLSYIGQELQAIADRIAREDEWEPTPGPACLSCLHIHACPLKDSETVQHITKMAPEQRLRTMLWHKAQASALNDLLKEHVKLTGEMVYLDGRPLYGEQTSEPGVRVVDWAGLVQLAAEADEVLRTPRSRLSGVARLLKPDKDVATLLLTSEEFGERARGLLEVREGNGKPRIGLYGNN
jgi:hypothetical protein